MHILEFFRQPWVVVGEYIIVALVFATSATKSFLSGFPVRGAVNLLLAIICALISWGVYYWNIGAGDRKEKERWKKHDEEMKRLFEQ